MELIWIQFVNGKCPLDFLAVLIIAPSGTPCLSPTVAILYTQSQQNMILIEELTRKTMLRKIYANFSITRTEKLSRGGKFHISLSSCANNRNLNYCTAVFIISDSTLEKLLLVWSKSIVLSFNPSGWNGNMTYTIVLYVSALRLQRILQNS